MTLFHKECFWRDLVAFTWNNITAEGQADIAAMLEATTSRTAPSHWQIAGDATVDGDAIGAWFTFETAVGRGTGHVRLKDGKCWTLFTALRELKGYEERQGERRVAGTQHGAFKDRKSWLELKMQEEAELGYTKQPYCVIIGGGQGGIALAARLRRLDVPTIIVEKNERPGDSWRKRYKSLCLHDVIWQNHLPYLPFPDDWPVFIYARLESAGFLLDYSDDRSGLGMTYMRRGSGYYIDVGASDLIAHGEIKLRSGVNIAEIKARSVVLTDGSELPADLIVYATGYGSMNGWVAKIVSQEMADKVGKVWGLGSDTKYDPGPWEGEPRNMWKPTQQPGLWFQGGNLQQARHYSIFLALQIKARMEGIPTPVYGLAEVYHRR